MSKKTKNVFIHTTEKLVQDAITFLQAYEPKEGWFLGFSGGKDSIVTEELCRMAGVQYKSVYACTRIDPPEVMKFIKTHYPKTIWTYPKTTFWKGIRSNGPATGGRRWCCRALKHFKTKHDTKYKVLGIRAEESTRRKSYNNPHEFEDHTRFYPIFTWKEWNVWEFIDQNKLPYPDLYDKGFYRLGCIVCPYRTYKEHLMGRELWPNQYRIFEKVVYEYYKRKIEGQRARIYSFEYYIDCWYRKKWPMIDPPLTNAFFKNLKPYEII